MTERVKRDPLRPCRRAGVWTLTALLVALTSACGEEPVEEAPVARPIKMLQLGAAGAGETREYPGTISATQHAEMAFEVPGKIIEFPVSEGQVVSEGTLLARLDPRDFEAQQESATASLKTAKAEYERMKILYEKGVNSKRDLEVAQRNYEVTVSRAKTAGKGVEDAALRAPFSGIVAKKLVDDFSNVQAKQPVLVLQDDSTLEIVVNLPERDMARARPGTSVEEATARIRPRVSVTSIPDHVFPARVKEYTTTADPVTRTFAATFAFEKPEDVVLRPGMTAKLIVNLPADAEAVQGHSIPASAALADESGAAYVWKIDPSSMRVSRVPVELGELSGAQVQVRSGLSDGDLIATSGVHHLREGMEVRRFAE
jgi:RND family efflux transporter MFP subunit